MASLDRDPVFAALTRPQMLAGVTYGYAVANAVITTELFLVCKAPWVLGFAVIVHIVGALACLSEPRFFDLWLTKVSRCPRIPNFAIWRCNSYRP